MFAVKVPGSSRASRCATARVNSSSSSHPRSGSSGTHTCRPLPPVVFTKLSRPRSLSRARTRRAAAATREKGSASSGSRSKITWSGCSSRATREFQGWISRIPACASATRPGTEST